MAQASQHVLRFEHPKNVDQPWRLCDCPLCRCCGARHLFRRRCRSRVALLLLPSPAAMSSRCCLQCLKSGLGKHALNLPGGLRHPIYKAVFLSVLPKTGSTLRQAVEVCCPYLRMSRGLTFACQQCLRRLQKRTEHTDDVYTSSL